MVNSVDPDLSGDDNATHRFSASKDLEDGNQTEEEHKSESSEAPEKFSLPPINQKGVPQPRRRRLVSKKSTRLPQNFQRLGVILQDFEDESPDIVELKGKKKWASFINPKMRYFTVMAVIIVISIVAFMLNAFLTFLTPSYDKFGVGILMGKGAALSILVLTMLLMFLVTYDLTTWVRGILNRWCNTLFDLQVLFHRF